jgi:predicted ATPase
MRVRLAEINFKMTWPYHAGLVAEVLWQVGNRRAALETATQALQTCRSTGERWYEAALVRLCGELQLPDRPDGAERAFVEAQEIARRQEAPSYELRAVTSLAHSLTARGETGRAEALLTKALAGFTEGYDTGDLVAAAALLDDLRT